MLLKVGETSVRSPPSNTSTWGACNTLEPDVPADRFDHRLCGQAIERDRPADQEITDIVDSRSEIAARSDFESRSIASSR